MIHYTGTDIRRYLVHMIKLIMGSVLHRPRVDVCRHLYPGVDTCRHLEYIHHCSSGGIIYSRTGIDGASAPGMYCALSYDNDIFPWP